MGQITFVNGSPIVGARFTLGGVTTASDAGGNFQLTPPPPPERFTPLANANADQVITDPRFPGFSLTIPAE